MTNPLSLKEWALCFKWKLKARVKSRNEIYPVEKILYENNIPIKYKVNGYWYWGDEKRQWWGRIQDIELIYWNKYYKDEDDEAMRLDNFWK